MKLFALLAIAASLLASPALAAIGTPVTIGTSNAASGASATLVTSVATNSCAAGKLAVISTSIGSGSAANSVADSQGNTWTAGNSYVGTSNRLRFFYSILTTGLSTGGDTITVTYSSTTGVKLQTAACVSNIQAVDLNPASGTTGTLPTTPISITTATLNHTSEVIFGQTEVQTGAADTFTEDTVNGWATVGNAALASNNKEYLSYVIVAATTAKTYAPTNSNLTRVWNQFYISFYETGAAASDHNLSSSGAGH